MQRKPVTKALSTHFLACLISLIAIAGFSVGSYVRMTSAAPQTESVEIGIEHTAPLALSIEMSTREDKSIVDISHNAEEKIFISVPADWERREVRSAPLDTVVADGTGLDYRRWHLPSGATVSYRVSYVIDQMTIHNPSELPVKVTLTRVDLNADTVERDILLIKESPKELW